MHRLPLSCGVHGTEKLGRNTATKLQPSLDMQKTLLDLYRESFDYLLNKGIITFQSFSSSNVFISSLPQSEDNDKVINWVNQIFLQFSLLWLLFFPWYIYICWKPYFPLRPVFKTRWTKRKEKLSNFFDFAQKTSFINFLTFSHCLSFESDKE